MISQDKLIRVIAIDPGYDRCGIAILEKNNNSKEKLIHSYCEETDSKSLFTNRLFQVISKIEQMVLEYKPEYFIIEKVFFSNNKKTAMHIAEARGAMLYLAKRCGLKIKELHPNEIKTAVTGDGRSTKDQMIKMIQLITGFKDKVKDDQYDAIAIGIAFLATYREGITEFD
jgi:crossover junction endodeoxyribonuclease RuvC